MKKPSSAARRSALLVCVLGYKGGIRKRPWKSSGCFIALVQLPLGWFVFFFPLSELVTLQMGNANTRSLRCCLESTTEQRFALRELICLPAHLPSPESATAA